MGGRPRQASNQRIEDGADRLCLGSDYPFDMSEPDPVCFHDRLDDATRARILGGNAADLLGLVVA